jgi:hypothetical protein
VLIVAVSECDVDMDDDGTVDWTGGVCDVDIDIEISLDEVTNVTECDLYICFSYVAFRVRYRATLVQLLW